jgi:hypothetical protein
MSVLAGETPSREVETLISFLRGPEAKEAMSHVGLTPL